MLLIPTTHKTKTIALLITLIFAGLVTYAIGYNKGMQAGIGARGTASSTPNPVSAIKTKLSVREKDKPDEADLTLHQTYTATINNETYKLPIIPSSPSHHTGTIWQQDKKDGEAKGVSATIDQTIDITPLLQDKLEKKRQWEIGTGLGYNDNKFYIPIAVQRNLSNTSSLELQINVTSTKVTGGQFLYKCRL